MTDSIPVIIEHRRLPMYYRAFSSNDKEPSEEHAELARQGYRDAFKCEPGAVSFYRAPDGKLTYYVIEDDCPEGRKEVEK